MLLVANLEINRGVCPPSRGPLLGCGAWLSATVAHQLSEMLRQTRKRNREGMNLFELDAIHSFDGRFVALTEADMRLKSG